MDECEIMLAHHSRASACVMQTSVPLSQLVMWLSQRRCSVEAEQRIRALAGGKPASSAAAAPAAASTVSAKPASSSPARASRTQAASAAAATSTPRISSKRARSSARTDSGSRTRTRGKPQPPSSSSSSDSSSDSSSEDDEAGGRRSNAKRLKGPSRATLETRPIYSSEEEEEDAASGAESTDAEQEDVDIGAAASAAAVAANHRRVQQRLSVPHRSLTLRLATRTGPPIKQWGVPLAQRTGELFSTAPLKQKRHGTEEAPGQMHDGERKETESSVKAETKVESGLAVASAHFSRPFDILPAAPSASASSAAADASAVASSSSAPAARYVSVHAPGITKYKASPAYTVTDHEGYTERPAERPSMPLTPSELAALTPISIEDACRENGLTLLRHQRVKLAPAVLRQVQASMKTVTGEVDRKVLQLCDNGLVHKCRLYRTDDYNVTLLSTDRLLSGEPIGAWMGTLRTRRTFAQRVGMEQSLAHIWAYETSAETMPDSYQGPDLVHDGSAYGNETHFLRDPKWSHQRADANIVSRLVWHQRTGLPYIAFVTLCDIEAHAELFIDWGDKCWKSVWRTQLTALAHYSHMQHVYLKSLQCALRDRKIDVLPQQEGSRFNVYPPPDTVESDAQRAFLDEELSPFATTSAVMLGAVHSQSSQPGDADGDVRMADELPVGASSRAKRTVPAAAGAVSFDHARADASAAAASAAAAEAASPGESTPSSPYTPSFNTHQAFSASTSRTMLTVFASALLRENTKELQRIARRLARHRANNYRRTRPQKKPLLEGAIHVKGQHTFELLKDPNVAFVRSGTRWGKEAKVDVSDETKRLLQEAFKLLRPQDFPDRKDEKVIRAGNVAKAAIYEVVGLRHPARFFTRPDQSAFSLVATNSYMRGDPIGVYIGVYRDFTKFHKASDRHAAEQVYAYDCMAKHIPGPPNPNLSEEERSLPVSEQLCYRGGDLIVESLYYGNEVRFMNDAYGRSASDATVNAHASIVWDRVRAWPCILVRATHHIDKGDEIICDYGDEFWNKVARSLMMDHARYGDEARSLILATEEWCRLKKVPLPPHPDTLPALFTQDREKDTVVYPEGFLRESAEDEDGNSTPAAAPPADTLAAHRLHSLQEGLASLAAQQQYDYEDEGGEECKHGGDSAVSSTAASAAPRSVAPAAAKPSASTPARSGARAAVKSSMKGETNMKTPQRRSTRGQP